ncbi:hypothetical protein XAP3CFBP6996_005525 [Xanthomonas citri pv. fuscans CFBP 6996]|uniref:hypothetical protein n=1 Tax=Xanthomonas citri TaxID=346 RepID=UPI000C18094D|nr:hypothetical protein [Xanthomonas citri]ATS50777.1 hypothetical protein XcfCFBP6992P_07590 [Xanthomonas citri pv. phaseoli var. fuscans]ATS56512.1 hypothetical protein XcfCFBP6994P_16315 [Xanthomonas citri pv. phaseoli var. fuscans]ATS59480.1 hypothetical protein XcfCFBP6996P_09415 [Xanthomonas citri pv. phaseoli var. fuscans]PTY31450.1 hypothetical protein XAP3CFBP6996_005525 [Xanthomonas citri pv. fuscans CFBP 6996]QWN15385.1 hypothetical protein DGN02_05540 [Xanthomonas citri]
MITFIAVAAVWIGVAYAAWVWTREYPDSAVALARDELFKLRAELFELAAQREISFESRGYQAARQMLNGLIRYAHDMSLTQMLVVTFMRRGKKDRLQTVSDWDKAIGELSPDKKAKVEAILNKAYARMFHLMVTRSVVLSGLVASVVAAERVFGLVLQLWRKTAKAREARSKLDESRPVEVVYAEVMTYQRRRRFTAVVRSEARRYSFGDGELVVA